MNGACRPCGLIMHISSSKEKWKRKSEHDYRSNNTQGQLISSKNFLLLYESKAKANWIQCVGEVSLSVCTRDCYWQGLANCEQRWLRNNRDGPTCEIHLLYYYCFKGPGTWLMVHKNLKIEDKALNWVFQGHYRVHIRNYKSKGA